LYTRGGSLAPRAHVCAIMTQFWTRLQLSAFTCNGAYLHSALGGATVAQSRLCMRHWESLGHDWRCLLRLRNCSGLCAEVSSRLRACMGALACCRTSIINLGMSSFWGWVHHGCCTCLLQARQGTCRRSPRVPLVSLYMLPWQTCMSPAFTSAKTPVVSVRLHMPGSCLPPLRCVFGLLECQCCESSLLPILRVQEACICACCMY